MTVGDRQAEERDEGVIRVTAFSDAVFAIAMTLLVLDLRAPDLPAKHSAGDLWHALAQWSSYAAFVLSFLVIGIYWLIHHHAFRQIRHVNGTLLWLNLIFLLGVTFIPYPTSVFDHYGDEQPAVMLYAGTMAVVGFVWAALWFYATRDPHLIAPDADAAEIAAGRRRALTAPLVFLLSLGVAWFNPTLATYTWLLLFVANIAGRNRA